MSSRHVSKPVPPATIRGAPFLPDSISGGRSHMTNRIMKRIIAAAIIIVISEKLRVWAKK